MKTWWSALRVITSVMLVPLLVIVLLGWLANDHSDGIRQALAPLSLATVTPTQPAKPPAYPLPSTPFP